MYLLKNESYFFMNMKQKILVVLFFTAIGIVVSWFFLGSVDDFLNLSSKGFKKENLQSIPECFRPLYTGFPNTITLLCYIVFTFSAFVFLKEKKGMLKGISIVSFIMIAWLFFFLF